MKESDIKPGKVYTLKGVRAGPRNSLPPTTATCIEKVGTRYRFEAMGGVSLFALAKNVHPADPSAYVPPVVPEPSVLPASVTALQELAARAAASTDPAEHARLVEEMGGLMKTVKAEAAGQANTRSTKKAANAQSRATKRVQKQTAAAFSRRGVKDEELGALELER